MATAESAEVFVPGLGFRSAVGARTLARPVAAERDGVTLWLGRCVSAGARTDLDCAFSGVDRPEELPVPAGACAVPWWRDFTLELRDATGTAHRGDRIRGGRSDERWSLGASFEALPPDTAEAELRIDGPLGSWRLPFELIPLAGIASAPLDVSASDQGVTLSALALARAFDCTVVRLGATLAPPIQVIQGFGDGVSPVGSGSGPVIIDRSGRSYPLRAVIGGMWRQRGALDAALLFPALSPDARDVTLRLERMLVTETAEPCAIPFPPAVGDYRLGRNAVRVLSVAPEQREEGSLRVEMEFATAEGRTMSRPGNAEIDGAPVLFSVERCVGRPAVLIVPHPGQEPFTLTLGSPLVELRGTWELDFAV